MSADRMIRSALALTALFNGYGALLFAAPERYAHLSGLPVPVPVFYSALLSALIGAFGLIYAWAALRPVVDRTVVMIGAIGKFAVFAVAGACFLAGEIGARAFAPALVDLGFGLVFTWWLLASRAPRPA